MVAFTQEQQLAVDLEEQLTPSEISRFNRYCMVEVDQLLDHFGGTHFASTLDLQMG